MRRNYSNSGKHYLNLRILGSLKHLIELYLFNSLAIVLAKSIGDAKIFLQ